MSNEQKLREALQAISHIDDTTNHSVDASAALDRIGQIARQALAMPTADHLPDAGKMVVDHFPDATKMIETAAPGCERERFEAWWRTVQMRTFPKEYDIERLQDWGSIYKPKALDAWQARAVLAGDAAVLAEREACAKLCEEVADDLITAMRKEGETDDEVMTSLVASARVCAEEIRGGYSKKFNPHNAAIDAAMRKDKP